MNTMGLISLIVGLLALLESIISKIVRHKIDYPELPFIKSGFFRGYKYKREQWNILIITNGNANYTEQIKNGFIHQANTVFAKTNIALVFDSDIGSPYSKDDSINKELLDKKREKEPKIIVTIGSQVSISAKEHLANKIPLIAIGIGAPVRSELIDPADDCSIDSRNLAVVRYGTKIDKRIDFLTNLFEKDKKDFKFIFIANPDILQDELIAKEVRKISDHRNNASIEVFMTKDSNLPCKYDQSNYVIFGLYHLNNHFSSFIKNSDKAVFLGLNAADTKLGAIASTGNNDYLLGKKSVDKILVPRIIKEKSLSKIKLVNPDPYYTLNMNVAKKKGFEFSKYAKTVASEIIDIKS